MPIDPKIADMTLEELRPYLLKSLESCSRNEYIEFLDWPVWNGVREEHKSKFAFLLTMITTLMPPDLKVMCVLFGNSENDKAYFAYSDRAEYSKFLKTRWPFRLPTEL